MSEFQPGDKVQFHIHRNLNPGTVKEVVDHEVKLSGKTVHASKEDPQYIIQHDNTGTMFNRKEGHVYEPKETQDDG